MNLELLCKKISYTIKNQIEIDEEKRSIIEYGLFAFLHMGISILSILIVGSVFNVAIESLIISCIIAILRKFSGGAHASTPINCAIVGILISVFPAYLGKNINLNVNYIILLGIIIYIVSFIIIYKLAPVDSPNKPIKKEEKIKKLKKGSITILCIYMIVVLFNIIIYYINRKNLMLVYSLCIYIGIAWQVFTLTKIGHSVVNIIDSLLIKIFTFKGGKNNEKNKQ